MNEEDLELPTSKTLLKRHKSLSGQYVILFTIFIKTFYLIIGIYRYKTYHMGLIFLVKWI